MSEDLLLPVLRQRWSPRFFDAAHELSDGEVDVLVEAARWAPSAGNSQPWAFHAVRRDRPGWDELLACTAASSRPWAKQASLLVVNLAHMQVADTEWDYSEFSQYDLGQAVAHMVIQAQSMGLSARQFRAFDKAALTERLHVPPHWEVITMTAFGMAGKGTERGPRSGVRESTITWPRA